jgi:hypothetical protein
MSTKGVDYYALSLAQTSTFHPSALGGVLVTDYYRNEISGTIHRQECPYSRSVHAKPFLRYAGMNIVNILTLEEEDRRLNMIHFCPRCMPDARRDLLFYRATTTKTQII